MNWKLMENHQIYLHTKNWVDRVQDGRLAAIFVCEKWHYLPIFKVSSFSVHNLHIQWIENLWQIYLHTENWVNRVEDGRLAAIFVCEKWHYFQVFQVSSFSVHTFTCTMNCKLVANHEIYQGTTFQSYWFQYLATRGQRHA